MLKTFEFWSFTAGLGFFLFAISQLENSLKLMAGRSFKKAFRKHTNNSFKSILVGIISTAILQSSSAVNLMLLAFVGSEVIQFSHALGIIIGSNLGTTFTGWIVSIIGFNLDLNHFSFPCISIGTLSLVFFQKKKQIALYGQFLLGIGLLFFGLNLMKESVAHFQAGFDLKFLSEAHLLVFAAFGLFFTAIIQSSSATMVITLTALNAHIIHLEGAAALIVGADLGTTLTVIIGSFSGVGSKRKVAAAHFFFNLITDLIALILLPYLLKALIFISGNNNPLITLVLFHSTFNFMGIIVFWPFLKYFASIIEKYFDNSSQKETFIDTGIPELNLELLHQHAIELCEASITINQEALGLYKDESHNYLERYTALKENEGKLLKRSMDLPEQNFDSEQSIKFEQILSAIRYSLVSAKNIKDIKHNLEEFKNSSNDDIHTHFLSIQKNLRSFYQKALECIHKNHHSQLFSILHGYSLELHQEEKKQMLELKEMIKKNIPIKYIASLFSVYREIYNAKQALLSAIANLYLDAQQNKNLQEISH